MATTKTVARKPTPVQREILALMAAGEEIEEDCYDYGGPCVGAHRHFPWRTFEILKERHWIVDQGAPLHQTGYWSITGAGRAALRAVGEGDRAD